MSNATEVLLEDEQVVLERYRRAKSYKFATVEFHIQNSKLIHINLTEKSRPEESLDIRRLREGFHANGR